jgi:hypothetical protein
MPTIGDQADVLRALGRWLDDQGASGVQITEYDVFLSVTWDNADAIAATHRAYQEHELDSLRAEARRMRQTDSSGPNGVPGDIPGPIPNDSLAELLRTLGQELDLAGVAAGGIVQEPGGFRVSGVAEGNYFSRLFTTDELLELSANGQALRGTWVAPPDPFASVTVGLAVETGDNQRLGRVGAIQGRAFKVQGGLLQRAYWLPAESVASVTSGERVVLAFPRAELDQHKQANAPSGA